MKSPFPVTYRELWLPQHINATQSAPFKGDAHALALTGAQKRTSADGVVVTATGVTSYVDFGAIHQAIATFWLSMFFKLSSDPAGGGNALWGHDNGPNAFRCEISNGTGDIQFLANAAGGGVNINIANPGWVMGQWYHVLCSISAANGERFKLDGASLQTNAATPNTPGGNLVLSDRSPGLGGGGWTTFRDVSVGTDDLTATEETELSRGIVPADAVNYWRLDEGRGVTVNDRGSGGNNGTMQANLGWKFGQVRQPIISLDGLNDRGQSSAGVRLDGAHTWVLVIKAKSTYNALSTGKYMLDVSTANGEVSFYYDSVADAIKFRAGGTGIVEISYGTKPAIDDYLILIGTIDSGDIPSFYVNGTLVGTGATIGHRVTLNHTLYLGSSETPNQWDGSKPLFAAQIDGALSAAQVKTYSRWLRDRFNLPISI